MKKSENGKIIHRDEKLANKIQILLVCAIIEAVIMICIFFQNPNIMTLFLLFVNYSILLVILWISIKNMRQIQKILLQKAESEKKAIAAELEQKRQHLLALESQINPHFLYNTLDTFRGLALENGNIQLSDMIEALSLMFKYSVNYEAEMVTINAELDYLCRYMQLQQLRFPGRFLYQEDINCTPEQLLLETCPRFVLQPLVENAIRHGLKDVRQGGCITVAMEIQQDDFYIQVEDNGCGMSQEKVTELSKRLAGREEKDSKSFKENGGIGLYNVNHRIKIFCGEEYGLKINSVPNVGTCIQVVLPLYKEAKINKD